MVVGSRHCMDLFVFLLFGFFNPSKIGCINFYPLVKFQNFEFRIFSSFENDNFIRMIYKKVVCKLPCSSPIWMDKEIISNSNAWAKDEWIIIRIISSQVKIRSILCLFLVKERYLSGQDLNFPGLSVIIKWKKIQLKVSKFWTSLICSCQLIKKFTPIGLFPYDNSLFFLKNHYYISIFHASFSWVTNHHLFDSLPYWGWKHPGPLHTSA
jgi:hypothetical protein